MKLFYLIVALILILLAQGCGTQPTNRSIVSEHINPTDTPEQLIAKALASTNQYARSALFFDAAQLYWQNNLQGQTGAALLSVEPQFLGDKALQRYFILNLKLGLAEENTERLAATLPLLANTPSYEVSIDEQIEFIEIIAQAYKLTGRHINAAIILAENTGLFPSAQLSEIHEAIWSELRLTKVTDIEPGNYRGENDDVRGWLELALAVRENQISLEKQYAALAIWKEAWPYHPAANLQPHELETLSQLPSYRPNKITLALPYSGPLSEVGTAIRDGFLASYYDANRTSTVDPDLIPKIHFYNTHEKDIERLYDERQSQNALIIGPLEKRSLNILSAYDELNTTTLALNYLEEANHSLDNLFQFGLSPEAETSQIAHRMIQKSLRKIAVIAPNNGWGFRVHDAFSLALAAENGILIESAFYDDQASLSDTVATMLATAESTKQAREIQSISGLKLEFLPRRRQDLDAIFMIAQAKTARQLNPLFSFHYAKNIPVFATSQVHAPLADKRELDLNRVEFVEMPWMLSSANNIKNKLQKLIPESSDKYNRFYALGADAYNLAPRLQLLKEIEGSQTDGQTGTLSMSKSGKINRHMQWATFKNGKAIAIQE